MITTDLIVLSEVSLAFQGTSNLALVKNVRYHFVWQSRNPAHRQCFQHRWLLKCSLTRASLRRPSPSASRTLLKAAEQHHGRLLMHHHAYSHASLPACLACPRWQLPPGGCTSHVQVLGVQPGLPALPVQHSPAAGQSDQSHCPTLCCRRDGQSAQTACMSTFMVALLPQSSQPHFQVLLVCPILLFSHLFSSL